MTLEEFLKLDNPQEYDFSNDGASDDYKKLDGIEKFFAYMMVMKKETFMDYQGKEELFRSASKTVLNEVSKYRVSDPDSNSKLLQEIYKVLWDIKPNMKNCISIQGETLNSANTTLNEFYSSIEDKKENKEEKDKRESIINENGIQRVSIFFILSKYLIEKNNSKIIKELIESDELTTFLRSYHTIGNFMPVPTGCNSPRGYQNNKIEDYWDLTLLHIYNYYIDGTYQDVVDIVKSKNAKVYKEWLDTFGANLKGWHNFVKINYLEPFVNIEDEKYFPKELWAGHFTSDIVKPQDYHECIEYFKNASEMISKRGESMIKKLASRIETN
ncbi:MAG: hypothetical protein J1F35_07630 [Erysipelotrichales bacterium]|nr:hypothetical protein [Erysipelotrichales bacterium]